MNKTKIENQDVSAAKTALDGNWNERKHLVEREFELRSSTEELIEDNAPKDEIEKARREESECRAALTANSDRYETLVTAWMSEVASESVAASV